MNPVAVFVGVIFWGWLWGIWGLLLGIPIMMVVKAVCDRVEDLEPIGGTAGGLSRAPPRPICTIASCGHIRPDHPFADRRRCVAGAVPDSPNRSVNRLPANRSAISKPGQWAGTRGVRCELVAAHRGPAASLPPPGAAMRPSPCTSSSRPGLRRVRRCRCRPPSRRARSRRAGRARGWRARCAGSSPRRCRHAPSVSPFRACAIERPHGGVRVLAAVLAHAGRVGLDVPRVVRRTRERRIQQPHQAEAFVVKVRRSWTPGPPVCRGPRHRRAPTSACAIRSIAHSSLIDEPSGAPSSK